MRIRFAMLMAQLLVALVLTSGCAAPQLRPPAVIPPLLGAEIPAVVVARDRPGSRSTDREIEEPSGTLTLRDALALALMRNPALASFSWEVRAREAEALQAGLRPNPGIAAEIENFSGSGGLGGLRGSETTIALSQLLELGGKRAKRFEIARLDRDLAAWDYEAYRIDVLTDVTKEFVSVLTAHRQLSLADEIVRIAEEVLASVSRQVKIGAVSPIEESRARVALRTSRVDREQAARELAIARGRLAATWGSSSVSFAEVVGDLEEAAPPPSLETLLGGVDGNPDLARWDAELGQRRAAYDLENTRRIPNVEIEGGLRRLNESGDHALVLGLAVPLPLFDRNQAAARAAAYRLAGAEEEQRAVEVETRTELAARYEALSAAYFEVQTLRDEVLPEASSTFLAAQDAHRKGLFSLTDVLDTQRTLFELQRRYFDALARYHHGVAGIERLIGAPLSNLQGQNGRP